MAQLADGGSLSGTVDADDNHNGGLGGILQRLILAQHLGDDLLNHAHNQVGSVTPRSFTRFRSVSQISTEVSGPRSLMIMVSSS